MNEILNIRGGLMKPITITILAILVALTLAFMPAPATTVHVVRYIPAGGTVWGAVESAMAETGRYDPGRLWPMAGLPVQNGGDNNG